MHWSGYLGPLAHGAWVTIQFALYSILFGGICSFAFGIGKLSNNWFVRGLSIIYIEIFRGTSLLVQLFWLFFALPIAGDMIGVDLRLSPVVAGVLALSFNLGAYGAEIVRGAIQAVSPAQYETARSLNFGSSQTLWRIALPQAIPEMMPSFTNLAIDALKSTSLVSLITLTDLSFAAEQLRNFYQDSTTVYTIVLLMYFGMALGLSLAMRVLEISVTRWRVPRR
ncbi:ectoine/hydroxyectoine ABC transporter permease protein EhuC 3 (plasmid) [Rhizobium gallicum]|uniref:Ectoine/hydroxyectoine ABC transporter permease protein EhuC 3 n=1 Tax=Rhizobium gallicum TaxID=56730 RepID=A0A1L5NR92_9HYPH|nr:ectoine/hydroxyectoine ABC transporter permease subunit EhuC [Rhizobium gallicum]APO70398.1 ectoine/hydroxyectoine ABC transporter permease protein EhuC 3 [Rhizobium gallicum]